MSLPPDTPRISVREAPREKYIPRFWDMFVIALITLAAIANSKTLEAFNAIHYVIYLAPPVLAALWFFYPSCRDATRKPDIKFVWLMLASLVIPAIVPPVYAFQYIIFMWWGFLPLAFPVRLRPSIIATTLIVLSLAQIALSAENGFAFKGLSVSSLSSGSASVTHTLPALFGLLLGIFVKKRQFKYVVLCIAMVSLAGKRSILLSSTLGVGAMLFCDFLFPPAQEDNDTKLHYGLILLVTLSLSVVAAMMPVIYEHLAAAMHLNINIMTSGRYTGQAPAYKAFTDSDMRRLLLGHGLGQVDAFALIGFDNVTTLIHNDFLRLAIDLGVLPAMLYVFCYLRLLGRGSLGIYLAVYLECAWLTENILINVMFETLLCIILSSGVITKVEKKTASAKAPLLRPFAA